MSWQWEDDPDSAASVGRRFIGALIRDARLRRGYSQRQVAWRSALAQSTISKLETGRLRGMRLQTLATLIGVLRMGQSISLLEEPAPPRRRLPGQTRALARMAAIGIASDGDPSAPKFGNTNDQLGDERRETG